MSKRIKKGRIDNEGKKVGNESYEILFLNSISNIQKFSSVMGVNIGTLDDESMHHLLLDWINSNIAFYNGFSEKSTEEQKAFLKIHVTFSRDDLKKYSSPSINYNYE